MEEVLPPQTQEGAGFELTRVRQFTNSSDRPTNTLRDGAQTRFGGSYSYYLAPGLVLKSAHLDDKNPAQVLRYTRRALTPSRIACRQ